MTSEGRALATGPSPWDEHDLSLPYDSQSEELDGPGSGVFRHSVVDSACPLFVWPEYHEYAGMGHRLSNFVMGLVAAIMMDLPLVYRTMEYSSKQHGNYSGLDRFLGMGYREWTHEAVLASWPNMTVIDLTRLDNWAPMARGGMFSPASRTWVWHAKRASLTRKCHIM